MTREEAEATCRRYAAEHPDRDTAQWRPAQQADGSWAVVRVGLKPSAPTGTATQADERPPTPPDPRPDIPNTIGPV